ncbi:hypothetical protein FE697_018880 [Mumia zhuanghuii]|uniref:Enoyl reductase n=2 Tax=Mumia TaxID=1546255 RepID=A0ABW1QJ54_9ACTN|nr:MULTISPECIES: hypothetical protein [Mumia]KAA1419958.1 hypothetical protein FE697_018880 [Mumia zhuanghuii]
MSTLRARALVATAFLALLVAMVVPAAADEFGGGGGGTGGGGTNVPASSPPQQEQIRDCTVYANGTGMGSYCAGGSGNAKTLRERFGGQDYVLCRYEAPPAWVDVPKSPSPDGAFMLKRCIEGINWDTVNGGRGMHLTISLEWVPDGQVPPVPESDLMDFLWNRATSDTALPQPFMRPQPSQVPVVGYPTYFTFSWIDPSTNDPIAEGPYAGDVRGGPYREVTNGRGLRMVAEATQIVIDPHQTDMKPITCTPDQLVYEPGKSVAEQRPDACKITFTRSSATAAAFADGKAPAMPQVYLSAYPVTVTVHWRITYGFGGEMQELGNGFEMTATQPLPVQEVQAPNEPPIVLF